MADPMTGGAANPHPGTPVADFDVCEDLVRRLLRSQHPDLASREPRFVDSGFDNVTYRLREDLALRLPRRAIAADLVVNEQIWLPRLAPRLPIPVPEPVRIGAPGEGYPWHWSVLRWVDGAVAGEEIQDGEQAVRLGLFLKALYVAASREAPRNPYRGCPLSDRKMAVEERMEDLRSKTEAITTEVERVWARALAAVPSNEAVWLHGDLHGRNILVLDGAIAAVLDWGDLTFGDRATDLASFWLLFDRPEDRERGLEAAGVHDPDLLARAKGWAVSFGVLLLATGLVDHPVHARMGAAALRRISDEEEAS